MSNKDTTKADRKLASAASGDKGKRGTYQDTPFGRRRTTKLRKLPKSLVTLIWLIGKPALFVYRRFRHSRAA